MVRGGTSINVAPRNPVGVTILSGDELQFGLATLAEPYRERLASGEHPRDLRASLDAIQAASEALERNPIEDLLLSALLLRLQPRARSRRPAAGRGGGR